MASESNSQQLMREGQETAGQAQERTEGVMDQAGTFLQQTGEQVKNIAAGAADAVKSTFGMNSANNTPADAGNNPHNPSGATLSGADIGSAAPAAVPTGAQVEAPAAAASAAPTAAASSAPGGSNASSNPGSAAH